MRHPEQRVIAGLSPFAAAFEFAVVWLTVAGAVLAGWPSEIGQDNWLAFVVLLPIIATVHLVGAERKKHQGSHLSLAPIFAAVLILPPALAAIAIAVAFVPESLRSRPRWYIVVFNVANFVGPALLARASFDSLSDSSDRQWTLGALVAIAVFIVVHYGVLAVMLRLARGVRVGETVRVDCVLIDAGLVSLGALAAALWDVNQALVALTLLPLTLAYRSLAIPGLLEATRVEPKTGLYNMRHFTAVLTQELERASRFDRPLALLMVDVDHLRQINTNHGHVAGDRALKAVAGALVRATREYDVAARFGGDEFCVLLPETELDGALVVAERVRALVEENGAEPRVTVSVGVATHRGGSTTTDELIALADRAAYRAKFSGRNAVAVPPDGDPVSEAERVLLDAIGD
ncbi:MAG TPA: GGDEF domain-containing protein [Gaiellaceae bacterium]|nr:GGDEF domain-containing protein [Gaiellaceae bacterium]